MMPPTLVGEEEEGGQSNITSLASPTSAESVCQNGTELRERNYMGVSDCSSVDSSVAPVVSDETKDCLHLKATELRLGLPGSQSPERDQDICLFSHTKLDEKPLFPLYPSNDGQYSSLQKNVISGNKRGFSDAMNGFSEDKFLSDTNISPGTSTNLGPKPNPVSQSMEAMDVVSLKVIQERPHAANESRPNHNDSANNSSSASATKTQVVGWPPIRSFRKNLLATASKNTEEVDRQAGPGALFVKVSMDGAPYLRKVDLKNYSSYQELSSALEKMFSCFTIGQYGSHGALGREKLSESKLKDLLHGSEYVLTYEDKDDDWMLVGDVPWEMFIDTCKRMRIMKSSDAIGLAPRSIEKCKAKN